VNLVRTRYDATVSIIFRLDCGFLDEKNFALCDQLRVGFVATGKTFEAVPQKVPAIAEEEWKEYAKEQQVSSRTRTCSRTGGVSSATAFPSGLSSYKPVFSVSFAIRATFPPLSHRLNEPNRPDSLLRR
jgi:hypothetical protein